MHNYDILVSQGFVYDAVLLWAYGVNRTLSQGGSPNDGSAVTANIFNIEIEADMTGNISIDDKGDRKFDMVLSIIQPGLEVCSLKGKNLRKLR